MINSCDQMDGDSLLTPDFLPYFFPFLLCTAWTSTTAVKVDHTEVPNMDVHDRREADDAEVL